MTKLELPSGIVTFLFTDIEGSTTLWDTLPEAMRLSLETHNSLLSEAITAHNGKIFKVIGDAFQAAFGKPTQAVKAAVDAEHALNKASWGETGPLRVRMGIHTGEAEAMGNDYVTTHTLNRVARVMSAGHGGQILITQAVADLLQDSLPPGVTLRDMGQHRLKGISKLEHLYQVMLEDLPQDFPPLATLDGIPNNLPAQLTSFVGRQREIAEIKQLLSSTRLLTLTGPGGVGKTRLAIEVGSRNLDLFQDGVFFVDLAPINDPQLVLGTITQALELKEAPSKSLINILNRHLHDKQMLLLLDNFEQIIKAAPLVNDLLSVCSELKVLVTSREPMRIYGEQEYPVPPLGVPDSERPKSLQKLSQYDAVKLFCQRARAIKPDFKLTEVNAPYIAEICVRLDGLPLAIELAAGRSKMLSPESICARLESRLKTLTGGARDLPARLRTLRAAIDWSYDLLKTDEQRLFNRLSVFQGGRTIEAVETICDSNLSITILDGLESLLNKNLLYLEEGKTGEIRFYMLETIHEYARERLAQSGEADDLKERHALYFVALAECAEAELHRARQEYWYARLTDELDNIRTVLNWTLADMDVKLGARLVVALREFWLWKGLFSESATWIRRVLENQDKISPATWAKTLNTSSRLSFARGDHATGERIARQALSIAREINDKEICAWALLFLSSPLSAFDDKIKEAMTYADESLCMFRELDQKAGIVYSLTMLGELARLDGDYTSAGRLYEESRALSNEVGNREREATNLGNLSYVAYHLGNYNEAMDYCKRSLTLSSSLQMEYQCAIALAQIAGPIGAKGDPKLAAHLLSASETQMDAMGATIQPADIIEVDQFIKAVRKQLGETDFNKAWDEGRGMTMEQALAAAMQESA